MRCRRTCGGRERYEPAGRADQDTEGGARGHPLCEPGANPQAGRRCRMVPGRGLGDRRRGPRGDADEVEAISRVIAVCRDAKVPVFVKQLGTWPLIEAATGSGPEVL